MHIKRNPQIGSTDWMLRMDNDNAILFPTEQEARTAMATAQASETPIENELAQQITGKILPQLRDLLTQMSAMQMAWSDNNMTGIIADAASNQNSIVGFSAQTWGQWAATFRIFQEWLETENPQLDGLKPRTVLMRRYIAQRS